MPISPVLSICLARRHLGHARFLVGLLRLGLLDDELLALDHAGDRELERRLRLGRVEPGPETFVAGEAHDHGHPALARRQVEGREALSVGGDGILGSRLKFRALEGDAEIGIDDGNIHRSRRERQGRKEA